MRSASNHSRVASCLGGATLALAVCVSACASTGTGESGVFEYADGGGNGKSASGGDGASSTGSNSSGGGGGNGDDSATTTGDDGASTTGDDGAGMAEDDGSSGSASGGGTDGGTGSTCQPGSCPAEAGTTYACVTTLPSPAPVCDSKHQNCLCTEDSQCNSNGLNVVNHGGCHSGHCSGTCTGGQNVDSAGCSVVAPTCNLGGNQGCPAKTTCEVNHGGCGGQVQCCWCTSDAACGVSGKCVDDSTEKQCNGLGPCTGSGSNYDGMHCQLASPGIPMCTLQ